MKDKCEIFRSLIPQYAAGELDAKTYAKLQRHIAKCPDCAALLNAQLESIEGRGKLHILQINIDGAEKKSKKRKGILIGATIASSIIILLVLTAAILRSAGFVRIASVEINDLSTEYVLEKHSDLLINETDLAIASNASKAVEEFFLENPDTHFSRFRFSMEIDGLKDVGFAGGSIGSETSSDNILISYCTSFHSYLLSWDPFAEPTIENLSKTRFSRFKIFDLVRETRLFNNGNEHFSEYTATLDLWGTLTRQELNR